MKRKMIPIILLIFSASLFAQWNQDANIDGKCSHIPHQNDKKEFLGLYNWQSPFLDNYDVTFYGLDIEVSSDSVYVGGNGTINGIALVPLDTFAFELNPIQLKTRLKSLFKKRQRNKSFENIATCKT